MLADLCVDIWCSHKQNVSVEEVAKEEDRRKGRERSRETVWLTSSDVSSLRNSSSNISRGVLADKSVDISVDEVASLREVDRTAL